MEKMDWKKMGLYFLAGFGAYALYKKYTKPEEEAEVIVIESDEDEDTTASFTGTRWQGKGRDITTDWQKGNVFSNASGGRRLKVGPSGRVRNTIVGLTGNLTPEEANAQANRGWFNGTTGKYSGRYVGMNGTNWQRNGQALNSGTNWQDVNLNACGACAG
jgi:hypothetical protein